MSEWRRREETPEPEDVPRWRVAGCSSTGAAWWDIKGQLETIKQLKVNFHRLTSDDAQEHFPKFPKLHDRTWLTLITKLQEAMTVAEHFLTDVDSNDWLRVQASLPGQLWAPGARARLWDINRPCERAIKVLEGVAALQAQILAGQHRKPDGEKRLEKPAFIPVSYRQGPGEGLLPEASYPERGESQVDPDYDILQSAEELSQSASDLERYRFSFRPDLAELEEMKSRREQSDERPSLVPAEHVPLREIAEKKGTYGPSGPPLKSMISFIAELDICKLSGHPPVRESSLGSNDSLSLDTPSNPITPRPVVKDNRSNRLPGVYKSMSS
ncbi:uncharacterized protein F4807DRAFT_190052 [Annulohypoxylon truncatum]|uniref:uncharacterized protein n=1 Tax=Annulohypoxylon truncatum TaxID=327061 RepID=UPI002007CAD4|nr:uncharacterized protein F4807DRAFT_190052 [Annulohypoxylon truncatum]KAI1207179.1 hypothetical protein F4807DRAFT_190052 [Annulohypoxylon truncatum]